MGPHKTKKILYRKGHHHLSVETAYKTGKNFISYTSDRRLLSRIVKQLKKIINKKTLGMELNREKSRLKRKLQMVENLYRKCSTSLATSKQLSKFILLQSEWPPKKPKKQKTKTTTKKQKTKETNDHRRVV
jgi:thiamine kinase-like enzyme